jgi:hypothetical protein
VPSSLSSNTYTPDGLSFVHFPHPVGMVLGLADDDMVDMLVTGIVEVLGSDSAVRDCTLVSACEGMKPTPTNEHVWV